MKTLILPFSVVSSSRAVRSCILSTMIQTTWNAFYWLSKSSTLRYFSLITVLVSFSIKFALYIILEPEKGSPSTSLFNSRSILPEHWRNVSTSTTCPTASTAQTTFHSRRESIVWDSWKERSWTYGAAKCEGITQF